MDWYLAIEMYRLCIEALGNNLLSPALSALIQSISSHYPYNPE